MGPGFCPLRYLTLTSRCDSRRCFHSIYHGRVFTPLEQEYEEGLEEKEEYVEPDFEEGMEEEWEYTELDYEEGLEEDLK